MTPLKRDIISVFLSMTMADDGISPDTIVEDGKYIPQKTQFLQAAEGGT